MGQMAEPVRARNQWHFAQSESFSQMQSANDLAGHNRNTSVRPSKSAVRAVTGLVPGVVVCEAPGTDRFDPPLQQPSAQKMTRITRPLVKALRFTRRIEPLPADRDIAIVPKAPGNLQPSTAVEQVHAVGAGRWGFARGLVFVLGHFCETGACVPRRVADLNEAQVVFRRLTFRLMVVVVRGIVVLVVVTEQRLRALTGAELHLPLQAVGFTCALRRGLLWSIHRFGDGLSVDPRQVAGNPSDDWGCDDLGHLEAVGCI